MQRPKLLNVLFAPWFLTNLYFLPSKIFPNKIVPNVPRNILRNHPFSFLALFWIVSLISFNNKPESSRD